MGIIINGQNDTIGPVDNTMSLLGTVSIGGTMTIEDFTNIDSVGLITARNGIDVTGGTVTITTGANSASPAGSGDNLVIKDSNGCGLSILSGNGNSQNIYLGSVSDNDAVRLEGFYNSGSPYFNIYTAGAERLRITSGGLIGISESTPDSKLDILHSTSANSNTENLIHLRTDPGASYVSRGLFVKIGRDGNYDNSAVHYDIVGSAGNSGFHAFEVQGDEKLRITKDGKVGIGTNNPQANLHLFEGTGSTQAPAASGNNLVVDGSGEVGMSLLFGTTASTAYGNIYWGNSTDGSADGRITYFGSTYTTAADRQAMAFRTAGSERLRITSDGKVGVGIAAPNVFGVHANNSSNSVYFKSDSGSVSTVYGSATALGTGLLGTFSNHALAFYTNSAEKLRITSGGELKIPAGIGPQITFENQHGHTGDAVISTYDDGVGTLLCLGSNFYFSSGGAESRYNTSEESAGIIINRAGNINFNTGDASTTATTRLSIDSTGQVTLTDSPGIQLSAKNSSLYAQDGSLSFYATNNAVYLNGAGTNGWLRLNAGGVENNHNAINIFGGAAGAYITMHTSNNERVRIDSSGNANFRQKVSIGEVYSGGEILSVGKSSGTSYMAFHNGGANMGFIGFADQLVTGGASNQLGIRSQDAIFFATGGSTERVRLDNDRMTFAQNRRLRFAPNSGWGAGLNMGGNGNSSDTTYGSIALTNGNLHLDPRGGSGYGSYLNWYTGGGGTYFGNGSGGQAGRIDASGNLTLSGTYPGSDLRLKENIETITGATDKIKALVGKTFTWKPESGLDSYKRYGFIAQEVQQVVPDLVKAIGSHYFDANDNLVHNIDPTESDEDRESAGITKSLTVNSEGITPILVEAMKELIAKNEALEARIAVLEGS